MNPYINPFMPDKEPKLFIDLARILNDKNPRLLKLLPKFIFNYLKKVIHQDDINEFIKNHGSEDALGFTTSVAKDFRVKISLNGLENIPKEGGAIMICNHPLGGLDAMALIPQIAPIRKDIKYIVNDILLNIVALRSIFVGINKHGPNARESLRSIEELFAKEQLLILFPAGLVSRKIDGDVKDLPWQKTFVTKAKKYNRPIIPVHISGQLSPFFYRLSNFRKFLGLKANIEMLYLADEMYGYRGKAIHYEVGKPIDIEKFPKNLKDKEICELIRKELYNLAP